MVVLIGAPGSGKSTVGRAVAEQLGVAFRDTDADIEQRYRMTIAEMFTCEGEAVFRQRERAAVHCALAEHAGVLALGGGAILDPMTRGDLAAYSARGGCVAWLQISAAVAARRVGLGAGRPLLLGNVRSQLVTLLGEREPHYREVADLVINGDELTVAAAARAVVAGAPAVVTVAGESATTVLIGRGLVGRVAATLAELVTPLRVAVIAPPRQREHTVQIAGSLAALGMRPTMIEVPDGEPAKSAAVAQHCWERLGESGFTRSDAIVAVGGGAITDLGGFVAATWLRGVPVLHVPTTLLGMVDAAVGGKTGINTAAGKNLVGVFHPPAAVICDLDSLSTLPRADLAAGLAEVVKAGFVRDPEILALVAADPQGALAWDDPTLRTLIERAIRVKAQIVGQDLRETAGGPGGREILNYGHTLGHAIEHVEQYRWRHGDCVAVGMVFAAEVAAVSGLLESGVVDQHRALLGSLGLPTSYPDASGFDRMRAVMAVDKKARGEVLSFILLTGIGQPVRYTPEERILREAWRRITTTARPAEGSAQ